MKPLFSFTLLLVISLTVKANPVIDNAITIALRNGNSAEIAKYFDSSIDLTLPSNEGVFSKAQAELILKTFFAKHKPTSFNIVHNGDSKNDSHYAIGNLKTNNGVFRTYLLYKEVGKKITILELRIESDE